MKKILSLFIILSVVLSLVSCSRVPNYKPQESTEEENTTVLTLEIDGSTYDVKYELYRAFFLNYKKEIDNGDDSVWNGAEKDTYIKKINEKILDRICEIYSAFTVCKRIGVDLYTEEVDKKINEFIHQSVKGGEYQGTKVEGLGSYDKYLDSLKEMNLNYNAQILLYRYSIAIESIQNHYIGAVSQDDVMSGVGGGSIEYTKEDIKNFYFGDNSARVIAMYIPTNLDRNPIDRVNRVHSAIVEASKSKIENDVVITMIQNGSTTADEEIKNGYLIGKYNLDPAYFSEMTKVAFELELGEVSEPIKIVSGDETEYCIMYKAKKSEENFEKCYENIKYIYLQDAVGQILFGVSSLLKDSVKTTDFLEHLDYSKISMD